MKSAEIKQSRFELRLSKEDKLFFEEASRFAGYKTLSGFVISAVREYAAKILKEKEKILLSQKDKEIFFNAVLSTDLEPNNSLLKASKKYLKSLPEK